MNVRLVYISDYWYKNASQNAHDSDSGCTSFGLAWSQPACFELPTEARESTSPIAGIGILTDIFVAIVVNVNKADIHTKVRI